MKASYPSLKTRVSVFACVDSVQKARYWEDAGADCICLDSLQVNREFKALEAIRKHCSCDLQLLVNDSCLQSCSLAHSHMTHLSHASQSGHPSGGFLVDWCFLKCTSMKLDDPINYIRADWIRPEDLHEYERLGYENFKIVEGSAPTELLLARVKAYAERRYDGNLLDLVQPYGHGTKWRGEGGHRGVRRWRMRYLFRPWKLGLASSLRLKRLAEARGFIPGGGNNEPIHVNNRELDGFIERFKKAGCREVSCDSCGHCGRYAERAVAISPALRDECRNLYARIFDEMGTGAFYGCAPRGE